jgi:hypothetical protein
MCAKDVRGYGRYRRRNLDIVIYNYVLCLYTSYVIMEACVYVRGHICTVHASSNPRAPRLDGFRREERQGAHLTRSRHPTVARIIKQLNAHCCIYSSNSGFPLGHYLELLYLGARSSQIVVLTIS